MQRMICRAGVRAAALAVLMLVAPCGTVAGQAIAGRDKLRAHSDEFLKDVIRMTDGVYVPVGYSASNVTLIQGDRGAIIVDTGSDPVEARAVRAALENLLDAPVRAIIYTHGHPDHTGGAVVFAGNDNPDIYSHQLLVEGPPDIIRGMRDGGDQFGMTLPDSLYINAGIQLQYGRVTPPTREGYVPPTRTFSGDQLSLTIAGVRLQLLHAPGETKENIAVWLPDKRVLMAGDDFYRAFPNLYPIRGGRLRPPEQWIASLERMLALGAEHLVPGHTRPITGAATVRAALTAYRDGIQSVLDQTLAGMRKGEWPDELVQHVKLPPQLADNPYLQEFYGSVAWSVRAIYADRLGWFDGNATRLFPLTERERAAKIIGLAGGADQVLVRARDALAAREFQWPPNSPTTRWPSMARTATRRESRLRRLRNWASGRSTPTRGTITSPPPSTSCGVFHPSEPWLSGGPKPLGADEVRAGAGRVRSAAALAVSCGGRSTARMNLRR